MFNSDNSYIFSQGWIAHVTIVEKPQLIKISFQNKKNSIHTLLQKYRRLRKLYVFKNVHAFKNFRIPISWQPKVVDLGYFKWYFLPDQLVLVWNLRGLQHQVEEIYTIKGYDCSVSMSNESSRFLLSVRGYGSSPSALLLEINSSKEK